MTAYLWIVASLVSNAAIIATEYLNRTATGTWATVLPKTFPLIVIAQYCLFKAFNGAPHWLIAWGVFTIGNSVMRIGAVATFVPGEVTSWARAIIGVGIMMVGALLIKSGLK